MTELPSLDALRKGSFCESAPGAAASLDASADKNRADPGAEAANREEERSLDAATPRRRAAAASLDMSPAARRRKREESGMASGVVRTRGSTNGSQMGSLSDCCVTNGLVLGRY